MKVLVTGATGYVGKHLIEELSKQELELYALIRKSSNTEYLISKGVNLIESDISNAKAMENINILFDAIIHLAFSLFPESSKTINETGFDNVLNLALRSNVKRFVYVSSQLVYGNTNKNELINEEQECNTTMKFGKQQVRAENKLKQLFNKEGFPCIILRPSEIYGGEGGFFKKAQLDGYINGSTPIVGNGNNVISFTYVGDLVQAILQSLHMKGVEGEVFNISTPGVLSLNGLVKLIRSKVKTKVIFKIPAFMAWVVATFAMFIAKVRGKVPFMDYDIVRVATMESGERSIEKAKLLLGFEPIYRSIEEGIIECYFSE